MKHCAALLGLVCLASCAYADRFDPARMDIADSMAEQNIPSLAVAVIQQGELIWEEGFGWSDVARQVRATAHTPYSIASISKPVTATALMILVERGLIDLNKPIDDYLGPQKLVAHVGSARDATVRRVANHTSGLALHYQFFYEDEPARRPSMDKSIRRYGVLVRAPGEAYAYSNFGYGLIEYAIERVSGSSYTQFLSDELFTPLGLEDAGVNLRPESGRRAAPRYRFGKAVPFYDFDHRGGSAVFMSVHDLVRFGELHLRGSVDGQRRAVLKGTTLAAMREKPVSTASTLGEYGIGWLVSERHGLKHFGHSGGMAGVSAQLAIYPDEQLVVAIVANSFAPDVYENLESSIVHAAVPKTIRNDHRFKAPPALVGLWKGSAQSYAGRVPLELEFAEEGSVFARVGGGARQEVTKIELNTRSAVLSLEHISGEIGTAEAGRYPYLLSFALKLRPPATLNGAITAISRPMTGRVGNAQSYWAEFRKQGR